MSPTPLYSLRELSDHVGRPVKFLRRAIDSGKLACHQDHEGATIYVTLDQWDDYLDGTVTIFTPGKPRSGGTPRRRARGNKTTTSSKSRRDPTLYAATTF